MTTASSQTRSRALVVLLLLLSSISQEHSGGGVEAFTSPFKTTANHHHPLHAQSTTKSTTYGIDAPYKEANYDPHAAAEYYKDRPIQSFSRLTQIVGKSSGFIVNTVLDAKLHREDEVVDRRSRELL